MTTLTRMIGFLVITDIARSKQFFSSVLGFLPLSEDAYGLTFDANGSRLRLVKAESFSAAKGTVLGWEVDDIHAAVSALSAKGAQFERYNLPYMKQDASGVWDTPDGSQVAWFKDPDGNVLSVSRHPHEKGSSVNAI